MDYLTRNEISKYAVIGYISLNGFDQTVSDESKRIFINQTIAGLNDVVDVIQKDQIKGNGVSLYSGISKAILPKSKLFKDKTLLVVGNTKDYVNFGSIEKKGVKYEVMTLEQFNEIEEDDLSKYCLLYFGYNSYTDISIYDLESNSLIYTKHFTGAKPKLMGSDFSQLLK